MVDTQFVVKRSHVNTLICTTFFIPMACGSAYCEVDLLVLKWVHSPNFWVVLMGQTWWTPLVKFEAKHFFMF